MMIRFREAKAIIMLEYGRASLKIDVQKKGS